MTQPSPMTPADASSAATAVLDAVETAVVGKRESLELVLTGILAGGHVLLEDLPGLGKTLAARSFAQALGLRSEEHTSELQSRGHLVCRLLLEKKNENTLIKTHHHDTTTDMKV